MCERGGGERERSGIVVWVCVHGGATTTVDADLVALGFWLITCYSWRLTVTSGCCFVQHSCACSFIPFLCLSLLTPSQSIPESLLLLLLPSFCYLFIEQSGTVCIRRTKGFNVNSKRQAWVSVYLSELGDSGINRGSRAVSSKPPCASWPLPSSLFAAPLSVATNNTS